MTDTCISIHIRVVYQRFTDYKMLTQNIYSNRVQNMHNDSFRPNSLKNTPQICTFKTPFWNSCSCSRREKKNCEKLDIIIPQRWEMPLTSLGYFFPTQSAVLEGRRAKNFLRTLVECKREKSTYLIFKLQSCRKLQELQSSSDDVHIIISLKTKKFGGNSSACHETNEAHYAIEMAAISITIKYKTNPCFPNEHLRAGKSS